MHNIFPWPNLKQLLMIHIFRFGDDDAMKWTFSYSQRQKVVYAENTQSHPFIA